MKKVILKDRIPKLGKPGDIVNVADGYARNYLLPKGLALTASPSNIRVVEEEKRKIDKKYKQEKENALQLSKTIAKISLTIKREANEEEKLFGSVTQDDIVNAINKENININKNQVVLEESIKKLGIYHISLKLHPEVTATLKVWIVKE